ncbi:MAG: 50S ribosomal protein L4 [Caldilineaceae bacterium]|nr:50S ribosomal protein L4 [Caldilineaceae bacterium]
MYLPVKDMTGNQTGQIEVSDEVFGAPVNKPLMHQALVRQLSNARLGTHKTKTRGEVRGGGRKPWKQKGTGRARQGSTRASQWVGGGTAFGPTPRTYVKAMPKKMHRAALRCALSAKAGAGQIVVLDGLSLSVPKTRQAAEMFKALGLNDQNVLLVVAEKDQNVDRSVRNLPAVKLIQSGYLNVRDLLGHDVLVLAKDAVERVEAWLGSDAALVGDAGTLAAAGTEE